MLVFVLIPSKFLNHAHIFWKICKVEVNSTERASIQTIFLEGINACVAGRVIAGTYYQWWPFLGVEAGVTKMADNVLLVVVFDLQIT